MITNLPTLALFYAYTMLSKITYVLPFFQSKGPLYSPADMKT